MGRIATAIVDLAYSEAGCGAYMNPEAADELYLAGASGTNASNLHLQALKSKRVDLLQLHCGKQ